MDRSQSILKSLVAAALLTAGLLSAGAALAQRAISNSSAGNDGTGEQSGPALVGCDVFNTYANTGAFFLGGQADACSVTSSGESIEAASSLAAAYRNPDDPTYTLSLPANATPDTATSTSSVSSGDLFSITGDGQGGITLVFRRQQRDDFLFAFSGLYGTGDTRSAWSAYYLFDDAQVEKYVPPPGGIGTPLGLMYFELSELVGTTSDPVRNYTDGLVVNQVSIYSLDRQAVPEPGSIALAGLGLALLVTARRLRRGARA